MTNSEKIAQKARLQDGKVVDDDGVTVVAGRIEAARPEPLAFEHDPYMPTGQHPLLYADWRLSKCDPVGPDEASRMDDLTVGIIQLVGECAEVSDLLTHTLLTDEPLESVAPDLLSEAGDVLFSLSWASDAWGMNPFRLESCDVDDYLGNPDPLSGPVTQPMVDVAHGILISAGLLVDAFKKVRFQRRPVNLDVQYQRFIDIIRDMMTLLAYFNFTIADALTRSVEKIDARYPTGVETPPGGFRTGKGA